MLKEPGTEQLQSDFDAFSEEFQAGVRAELELMLAAPFFAQSNRCKSFLSYVVGQTLSGQASQLKERTIGIGVFGRANDYDTGETSIVRVTANEVRKRIDQYYRESKVPRPIQIALPRGSYVPEFKVQPFKQNELGEKPLALIDFQGDDDMSAGMNKIQVPDPQLHAPFEVDSKPEYPTETPAVANRRLPNKSLTFIAALVLVFVSVALTLSLSRLRTAEQAIPKIWESFSHSSAPVLLCVDAHDIRLPSAAPSPNGQNFVDLVLHKQIISLDDAAVLSSMAELLGKKGIPFRVVGAEQTSLSEFRRQPVILIGAIDNKWTIRLTQSLRYRIEITNPPGSGSGKEPVASIVDSEHPDSSGWTVDLSVPYGAWKNDYAVVARMDDATTGVPVLIEAGLGGDGSLAASELLTSGELVSALHNEPHCNSKSNFEAVLSTDIIDTRPGPPHILRINCW